MNRILKKQAWLAGASLLAIVLGSGDANAVVFQPLGGYIVPSTGWYDFRVAGAQGEDDDGIPGPGGGAGALVGGELFLAAGTTLAIVVGGNYGDQMLGGNGSGGGGGGGSFVFGAGSLLFAAGGGGGADFIGPPGGPGIGSGPRPGGGSGYGYNGAGGLGVPTNYPFSGPDYLPGIPAQSGSFPNGGQGAQACFPTGSCFTIAPSGGYGGGGGGGYESGGGGGGAPGGAAGQGGYSFVTGLARDPFGITGGNPGYSGYVSINAVVPEPSTWAMMLAGFTGLGWLARLRRRKLTPT
jgi:PEP-CTERM motif-containing protein